MTLFAPAALAALMALPFGCGVTFSAPHSCCRYAVRSWNVDEASRASQKRVVVVFKSPAWVWSLVTCRHAGFLLLAPMHMPHAMLRQR
jgi:hypothetical protein